MMNCHKVRKYLFAFADSQLSVQANCEVLDHLKMCPTCSAVVDEHQVLRRAILKSAEKTRTPSGLESKVRRNIERDGLAKAVRKASVQDGGFRFARVAALAACLLVAVTLLWPYVVGESLVSVDSLAASSIPGQSAAEQVTNLVVLQHNKCKSRCDLDSHQNRDLPRDRSEVAAAIDRHFKNTIAAAAPDLTGYGLEFESANFCNPTEDKTGPAAHVMYVNFSNSSRISLFTIPHWAGIDRADEGVPDRQSPFAMDTGGCDNNALVAWHEGDMTYVLVGQLDVDRMKGMIQGLALTEAPLMNATFASALLGDAMRH